MRWTRSTLRSPDCARIEADLAALIGPVGDGIGSNSWAVAPEQSATGSALLANDPHLGPAMPSVWYQVGVHCRALTQPAPTTSPE